MGTLIPSRGKIEVDSIDSNEIVPSSRYDKFSTVMQSPARYYTFTVTDNVYMGDTKRVRDETILGQALDFAGFSDIERNTVLGKDLEGLELSGGEWQKLAIARASYRNRDFYILDEPTSSLDPLAEADIFSKYLKLAEDKTVIFVTHRISAASLADRIIVLEDGKVVEDGSHEGLMRSGGKYAELYAMQAQWYQKE